MATVNETQFDLNHVTEIDTPVNRELADNQKKETVTDVKRKSKESDHDGNATKSESNGDAEKQLTGDSKKKEKVNESKTSKKPLENKIEYKGLCTATFHYLCNHESARTFLNQHLPTTNVRFLQGIDTKGVKEYGEYRYTFEATLDLSDGCSLQTLETILTKAWTDWAPQNEPYGWFEIRPKDQRLYRIHNQLASEMKVDNIHVAGGAMTSPSSFVQHWDIRNILHPVITFEHDKELITVSTDPVLFGSSQLVMEMPYNSINDSIIVACRKDAYRFYIGTKHRPKMYYKRKINDLRVEELRVTSFDNVSRQNFGLSSALCITIPDIPTSKVEGKSVWDIITRLKRTGFSVEYADVENTIGVSNPMLTKRIFIDFEKAYAWESLLSHGFKVMDVIDDDDLTLLEETSDGINPHIFFEMADGVEDVLFFDFKTSYKKSSLRVTKSSVENEREDLPQHFAMIRRMVITPTSEIFLQKEPIVQNRILRQYDNDFFIRIVLRDEDFERLSATLPENLNEIIDRLKDKLRSGFDIGGRHYDFLACSNSQLREHGVWFFAANNGITSDKIRKHQGDFSTETCVASYVSRLALCFSSSRDTVDVAVDEGSVMYVGDIERGGYCFTDGIGQISVPLANKVAATLNMESTPSAFQIRHSGCKGVVSQDPKLGDTETISVRPSMKKFESPSKKLEILQVTHPGRLFMNRQVITLMSGLGVPDHEFLSLQESMLLDMADMMLYEDKALGALSGVAIGIEYKQLQKAGSLYTKEPFFQSVLMTLYKSKLSELLSRSRIEIPYEYGRSMMGTVDETGILRYNQVFIAYSKNPNIPQKEVIVHTGEVVVTKNPCFHPGDLRKFSAVDIPDLHHMIDCIVFPQEGERPHPNEMSGSDLDGDMYFVCWDKKLIPPDQNKDPMQFPKANKLKLYRPVEVEDIIRYIGDYIKLDQLGIIANAHVVHADLKNIYSQECLQLAQMHSEAVDFPKTGKAPTMQRDLRVEKYPDFMRKSDKPSYTSNKILGKLFRQCRGLEQVQKRNFKSNQNKPIVFVDTDLKYSGYENFINDAIISRDLYNGKVLQMMALYGIETESEIVSGVIQRVKRKRGSLRNEKYEIGQIIKAKMSVIRDKTRTEFFKEFNGYESAVNNTKLRPSVLAKASAWYIATYDMNIQVSGEIQLLSFPWIISDILADLKTSKHPRGLTEQEKTMQENHRNKTSLHQIGFSIVRHYDQTKQDRISLLENLLDIGKYTADKLREIVGADLNVHVVGNLPAGLLGTHENVIEMYVSGHRKPYSPNDFDKFFQSLFDYKIIQRGKNPIVEMKSQNVLIMINQSRVTIQRSQYLRHCFHRYNRYLPVFLFLLDLLKSTGKIGKFKNNILEEQIFVLMVIEILRSTGVGNGYLDIHDNLTMPPHMDSNYPVAENLSSNDILCEIAVYTLRILRDFSKFAKSKLTRDGIIEFKDPSDQRGNTDIKIQNRDIKQITDEMLFIYQEIAKTKSVDSFFGGSFLQEGHFVQTLPLDVWGSIMFAEAYSARRLSEITGAEVHIRRTHFREVAGLILEAWGTDDQLWNVMKSLQNLSDKSSHVVTTLARDKIFISGAFHCVFEGCSSESNIVSLLPYNGPTQPDHDNKVIKIPSLLSDCYSGESIENRCDFRIFTEIFTRQLDVIRRDFDPTFHGELRLGLAFGTYYVTNASVSEMTVLEFTDRMNKKSSDNRFNLGRGRGRGRVRGRRPYGSRRYSSIMTSSQMIRSSFIPIEFQPSKIQTFLRENHFSSDKVEEKYHVSIKFGSPDYGKQQTGTVILDKEIQFLELRLSDIKWLAIDLVRKTHRDIRCKIQSRRMVHIDAVKEMDDIKPLQNQNSKLLLKYGQHDIYVNPDFRNRVTFVRKKSVTRYQYNGPVLDSSIWHEMKIEVAMVTEYSRQDEITGRFSSIVSRNEVTIIPSFPSLENEEEWGAFAENVWRLVFQLGKILE